MRLDVPQARPRHPGESGQCTDLVDAIVEDLILRPRHFDPAEMLAIRKARVSADLYAMLDCRLDCRSCRRCIPRMKAAGDVDRRHERHELPIPGAPSHQVAIQINFHVRIIEIRAPAKPRTNSNHGWAAWVHPWSSPCICCSLLRARTAGALGEEKIDAFRDV